MAQELSARMGDKRLLATAINHEAVSFSLQTHYAEAESLHAEALRLRREIHDSLGIAKSLINLGIVAHAQGYLERALKYYERFPDQELQFLAELEDHIQYAFTKAKLLDDLRKLNEKKNELLGFAAHDLRSPLSVIMGYAGFLKDRVESDPETLNDVDKILTAVKRMNQIVNQVGSAPSCSRNSTNLPTTAKARCICSLASMGTTDWYPGSGPRSSAISWQRPLLHTIRSGRTTGCWLLPVSGCLSVSGRRRA